MRIISLNVWLGKLKDPLIAFLQREAPATDIFCFQEMKSSFGRSPEEDLFSVVARSLPGFQGFFEATQDEEGGVEIGLATFIKRVETIDKEGDFFVYRTRNSMVGGDGRTMGRNAQFIEFPKSGKEYAIVNFHGLWSGKERLDSEVRIEQSKKLKGLLNALGGTKIVCGDFNLTKDTESLAILDEGMRNLITESGITSTRPERYFPYPDKFCDYILVDNDVKVKEFKVLEDEASDHLPLVLDFE
jgi:endonuclease/exonuclease/phosphatase family metal-dependent hydrolase